MNVTTDDITLAWGQQPHQFDRDYGKWRMACFQDVQESIDCSKLYFLYDPQADEQCGTTGTRKGYPGLVIFDVNIRCFAGEIPIHNPGAMKFLFALKCPSPQGGTSFVLVTEENIYGQIRLNVFRIDLSADGLSVANSRPLIPQALQIGGEYICSMREDVPEIVVMANPGLQIWRVNCMVDSPQPPTANFTVPGADLSHFYDGFLSNGSVHLLSASPDGHLDYSRVHVLNLDNPGQINTHNCTPDPQRGMPQPRKQCGIDSVPNAILFAGGEIDRGYGNVERLQDYWVLDTRTFQWNQVPSQMPCPLIEPRLTVCNSGNIFLWGDFDQPLPGMPPGGTHLRILRINGMERAGHPPTYNQAVNKQPPNYPSLSSNLPPYPQPQGPLPSYPQAQSQGPLPPYPSYNPSQSSPYQNQGYGQPQSQNYGQNQGYQSYGQPGQNQGPGTNQTPSNMHAYYPPQQKKDKCSLM